MTALVAQRITQTERSIGLFWHLRRSDAPQEPKQARCAKCLQLLVLPGKARNKQGTVPKYCFIHGVAARKKERAGHSWRELKST